MPRCSATWPTLRSGTPFTTTRKRTPNDLADYMQKAFSSAQVTAELSDPDNIFLIAEI